MWSVSITTFQNKSSIIQQNQCMVDTSDVTGVVKICEYSFKEGAFLRVICIAKKE
jgi:hypothetical protein